MLPLRSASFVDVISQPFAFANVDVLLTCVNPRTSKQVLSVYDIINGKFSVKSVKTKLLFTYATVIV